MGFLPGIFMKDRISQILSEIHNWHILVVGNGGTGSNLVPHLSQLANSYKGSENVTITLADEDIVEPGNIGRQFFIEQDLGSNKARVLQIRYTTAWSIDISYHPYYIREDKTLIRLLTPSKDNRKEITIPILIGAVDNHYSRQIFHRVFQQAENLIYLDAGNSEFAGQVVMGFRYGGETLLAPVAEYYPDILTAQDEISAGGSCGRHVVKEPQSLVANMWAATTLLSFLNNIIGVKKIPTFSASFNAHNIVARPEYIK